MNKRLKNPERLLLIGAFYHIVITLFWGFKSLEKIIYFGVRKLASNPLLLSFSFGTFLNGWTFYLGHKLA